MKKITLKNINGRNVKIKIVDDEKKANFITHSGTFHADEIMASVILLNIKSSLFAKQMRLPLQEQRICPP